MYETAPTIALGPVRLATADVATLQDFHERVLGLRRLDDAGDEVVRLGADAAGPALLELLPEPGAPAAQPGASGLALVGLRLPDRASLAAAARRVRDAGWPLDGAASGVHEGVTLADPEGNRIELSCDRPRAQWLRDERNELRLASAPLDLDALLAEAADAPGDGALPASTTVGHVHLRAPDLARAERFFVGSLGMAITARDRPDGLYLASDGHHHHVRLAPAAADAPAVADARGLRGLTLLLEDRDRDRLAGRISDGGQVLDWDGGDLLVPDPLGLTMRLRTHRG